MFLLSLSLCAEWQFFVKEEGAGYGCQREWPRRGRGRGMLCTHSRLPGMEGFRGPLGSLGCRLVLQQQKGLWKPCGFFFFRVVRNCMCIPLLRSSLVWSPGETTEALQLCQHFCTSFCWHSSSACSLSIDQGVSPTVVT